MVVAHLTSPAYGARCACTSRWLQTGAALWGLDRENEATQPGVALHACFAKIAGRVPKAQVGL